MISISIREKVKNSDYKYIITKGACAYCAFHTEKGFNQFIKIANLKLENPRIVESEECGKVFTYIIDAEIIETSFWDSTDIPVGANKFKGLSNGSYVDCYYVHTDNGSIIFRPNPNAKEVYKPLTLQEHLAYSRVNG